MFFFTLNLIQIQGYSATAAGAALLPFIVIMFSLSRWSGGLVDRFGARLPLTVGPIIAAVGLALFAVPAVERKLLDEFLSGGCCSWIWNGDHCGAFDDHRDERCW